jgi:hypothetical protein
MKLRVRGNSLRIRVSQGELNRIASEGSAGDAVRFAPGRELAYRIEAVADGELRAEFSGDQVLVRIPRERVQRWMAAREVSIAGEQAIGDGEQLRILIEKDFNCLAPREGEDAADLFPNPLADQP